MFSVDSDGLVFCAGGVTAASFKKPGGTSAQFLKADGSVDSSVYAVSTHNHDSSYAALAGSTANNFSAKALTLAGAVTGATTGSFSSNVGIGGYATIGGYVRLVGDETGLLVKSYDGSAYTGVVAKSITAGTDTSAGLATFHLGSALTYDPSTQAGGSVVVCNGSSSHLVPVISGKSTSSTGYGSGLSLLSATHNDTSYGDMVFNIRENDNSDYSTLTMDGFKWTRYATTLMSLKRNGALTVGAITAPSVSCSPTISSGTTAPATTPAKVGDIYVDTVNKILWIAVGAGSSADWEATN
jgi:hypothetical protein